jgi:hypothetical protein
VLVTTAPLTSELEREGWRVVQTDHIYTLLARHS